MAGVIVLICDRPVTSHSSPQARKRVSFNWPEKYESSFVNKIDCLLRFFQPEVRPKAEGLVAVFGEFG